MNIDLLNILFKKLEHDDLSYAYTGSFTDALAIRMIDIARHNIESWGEGAGLMNRVSFLMGECYQNIVRHGISASDIKNLHEKSELMFLRVIGDSYYITSANLVENSSIDLITSKLDRINSLSQDELKELQQSIMLNGQLNAKGGAGLGIILMARKTRQKIAYRFEKLSDNISLFYLHTLLRTDDKSPDSSLMKITIDDIIAFHDIIAKEGLLLMHKGDFSQETFLPVIKMIEGNMKEKFEHTFISTKLYHLIVEILQNISRHGSKERNLDQGIFLMGSKDNNFIIGSSNYIERGEADSLLSRLNELKTLSKKELDMLYRDNLRLVIEREDQNVGLGLIDIFRYSKSVDYRLDRQPDKYLFSLVAII